MRTSSARGRFLAVLAVCGLLAAACSDDDAAAPTETSGATTTAAPTTTTTTVPPGRPAVADPVAEVSGPLTGGIRGVPYNPMPVDVREASDYREDEYQVAGTATSYLPEGEFGEDGFWSVTAAGTADFATRVLVRRPADPTAFNGVVVVEWLNVSAGRDSDPDFGFLHPLLVAEGAAYVGVSAQRIGVEGGGGVLEVPGVDPEALLALKPWDPERYADLSHPGDQFSYDIFGRVGTLLREPGAVDLLDGLEPTMVLAVGESQSAGRLVTYVNAVHPVAPVFDGFLIHSRFRSGAAIAPDLPPPRVARLRTDRTEPVLQFETETDVVRGFVEARQPDTPTLVTWEVAGTAHADQSTLAYGTASSRAWFDGPASDFSAVCGTVNDGPQAPVLRAAFRALVTWVDEGTPPSAAPPLELADGALVLDEIGNALGGIRTPAVDAPVSVLTGVTPSDSPFCSLFGQTTPLSPEQLASLYPTVDDHVAAVTASADAAVAAGFLLPVDRDAMVEAAAQVDLG